MNRKYFKRIADIQLRNMLESSGAVLIEGPKWCGKTRTAMEAAASQLFLQDPDKQASYLKAADTKPSLLLKGETPRLLDEWQIAPVLWDAVRFMVDQRGEPGQFILTGSAVPKDNAVRHTGTGRISRLLMRPMSLFESQESHGDISMRKLFSGEKNIEGRSELSIEQIAFVIARGGWPASIGEGIKVSLRRVIDYTEAIINADISRVDGIAKNPMRVRALMRSLARNISTHAKITTIYRDIAMQETDEAISTKTIGQYLDALDRIFVTENIPAWNPAIRSKAAIRTSPKRQFVDPSIAIAVMRLTPERLLEDFEYFGFLFESLCARDLRIYADANDGQVFHYLDSSGLEADTVICLNDGRWAPVEIKLGSAEIEKAAQHLLMLKEKINTSKMREPSFLMVLTGTEYAYRRKDGVLVVPIGCLKD
ncbi:MAG: ATP-binding protein [Clostridiales bacterium]|nr:ATP-binding protein [Clostridiales bacterium]